MAKFFTELTEPLKAFIAEQQMFFVATAPGIGRVSLSPKGMDTFRVIDDRTVAYLDITGSGNETSAHLEENGRITVMFCSFGAKPMILRLYGRGEVVRLGSSAWDDWIGHFNPEPGMRQVMVIVLESLQTSCGYGVPRYDLVGERDTLRKWAVNKGDDAIADYRVEKNMTSIDGLPTGWPSENDEGDS